MGEARRVAVLGRTSCVTCRRLMRSPAGNDNHQQLQHPKPQGRINRTVPDLIGRDGRRYCVKRHPAKVIYDTIDTAWVWAFIIFVERGYILTPYHCGDFSFEITNVTLRTGNPVYLGKRYNSRPQVVRSTSLREIFGCGRWHLTNRANILKP